MQVLLLLREMSCKVRLLLPSTDPFLHWILYLLMSNPLHSSSRHQGLQLWRHVKIPNTEPDPECAYRASPHKRTRNALSRGMSLLLKHQSSL